MWQKQSPGYAETEFPAPRFTVVLSSRTQAEASPLPPPLTSTEALQSKDSGQLCWSPPRAPQGGLFVGVQTPPVLPSALRPISCPPRAELIPGTSGRQRAMDMLARHCGRVEDSPSLGSSPGSAAYKRSAFGQITLSVVLPLSSSPHRVDSRQ